MASAMKQDKLWTAALLVITGPAKRALLEKTEGLPVAALIEALQPRILWAE